MLNLMNKLLEELIIKHRLPQDGLYVLENKGAKNSTYTLVINEQPFPVINKNVISRSMIILNFIPVKPGITELIIKNKLISILPYPTSLTSL